MALVLRRLTKDDIAQRLAWPEYPCWARYSDFYCFGSEEDLWRWCNTSGTTCYAAVKTSQGESYLVGFVAILDKGDSARISLMLHPDCLSTSVGGRLILRALVHCFVFLGARSVEAVVAETNRRMLRIASAFRAKQVAQREGARTFVLKRSDFMSSRWFSDRYLARL